MLYTEGGYIERIAKNKHRLVLDGSVNRYDPETKLWVPQRFVMSEAINTAGGKALLQGRFGYWCKWSNGQIPDGALRVYPNPADTSKYIIVGTYDESPLTPRQVNDKYLELFYEHPSGLIRLSLIINEHGLKTNIRVRSGYSGNWAFPVRFEVVGYQQVGRRLYDNGEFVCNLPDPFALDEANTTFPVQESVSNGIATLTAQVDNPVGDVDIDPTVLQETVNADTYGAQNTPTTNYGASAIIYTMVTATNKFIGLVQYDMSAIGANEITSASLFMYCAEATSYVPAQSVYLDRIKRDLVPWTEGGATYNTYDGTNAWLGGNLLNDANIDAIGRSTATVRTEEIGQFVEWDVLTIAQQCQALDNVFSVRASRPSSSNQNTSFASKDHPTSSVWPYMMVEYSSTSAFMDGGLGDASVYMGHGNAGANA